MRILFFLPSYLLHRIEEHLIYKNSKKCGPTKHVHKHLFFRGPRHRISTSRIRGVSLKDMAKPNMPRNLPSRAIKDTDDLMAKNSSSLKMGGNLPQNMMDPSGSELNASLNMTGGEPSLNMLGDLSSSTIMDPFGLEMDLLLNVPHEPILENLVRIE